MLPDASSGRIPPRHSERSRVAPTESPLAGERCSGDSLARPTRAGPGQATMTSPNLYDRIKQRAYLLWEQEGRPEGRADEHWFRAEAEVAGINSGEEAPPGAPGAGEHICPACKGTGRISRKPCKSCGGTGRIISTFQNREIVRSEISGCAQASASIGRHRVVAPPRHRQGTGGTAATSCRCRKGGRRRLLRHDGRGGNP